MYTIKFEFIQLVGCRYWQFLDFFYFNYRSIFWFLIVHTWCFFFYFTCSTVMHVRKLKERERERVGGRLKQRRIKLQVWMWLKDKLHQTDSRKRKTQWEAKPLANFLTHGSWVIKSNKWSCFRKKNCRAWPAINTYLIASS